MTQSGGHPDTQSGEAESRTFRRDMSISHADFLRLLPTAIRQAAPHLAAGSTSPPAGGGRIQIGGGGERIEIELGPEQSRRFASLTLPRTEIVFRFFGRPTEDTEAMMARIDAAYRRGGG